MSKHSRRPLRRRRRCHAFTAGFVAILITCQSCATMVQGTKQRVAFTASVDTARITIDRVHALSSGDTLKLKRNKDHFVSVQARGYEPVETMINRRLSKPFFLNLWVSPVAEIGGLGMYLVGALTLNPLLIGAGAGTMVLGPITSSSLAAGDMALGGAYRFEPSYHFKLYELPTPFQDTARLRRVQLGSVAFAQEDQRIGTIYRFGQLFKRKVVLQASRNYFRTNNYRLNESLVHYELEHGFEAHEVKASQNNGTSIGNAGTELIVGATIKDIQLESYRRGSTASTNVQIAMEWHVTSPATPGKTLHIETTADGQSQGEASVNAAYLALRHNLYQLLEHPDFRSGIEK